MARIEIDGIYKHAPLTEAQISGTKRNLDREIIIKTEAIGTRAALLPVVTNEQTQANAYPSSYIYAMDYDSTDHGGNNDNIRRHIPTLELLGSKGSADKDGGEAGTAGSSWINIETNGTYSALTGGQTLQAALEALDASATGAKLMYIIDGSEDGSLSLSLDGSTPVVTNTVGDYQIALGEGSVITDSANSAILSGKDNNITDMGHSFIGGGQNNILTGDGYDKYASVVGGYGNTMTLNGYCSFIGGGSNNTITDSARGVIVGGDNNIIDKDASYAPESAFIGSGQHNKILNGSGYSSVVGGSYNYIDTSSSYSFIGGGHRNKLSNNASSASILGGDDNSIDGGYQALILGGNTNVMVGSASRCIIIGGQNNTIGNIALGSDPKNSIIGAGGGNIIEGNGFYSGIFTGSNNRIQDSQYSTIIGGSGNTIHVTSSDSNSIITGSDNYIGGTISKSVIVGGVSNYIIGTDNSAFYAFIGTGSNNYIDGSYYSGIVSGQYNKIIDDGTGNPYNFIGAGQTNIINSSSKSSIVAGDSNYISDPGTDEVFIGAGYGNYITGGASRSSIISGTGNVINQGGNHGTILGGSNNNITYGSTYGFIGVGETNLIYASQHSVIINGVDGIITNGSTYAIIGNGSANTINNASYGAILGGRNNILHTVEDSFIIGSGIDTTNEALTKHTYMNNITLWDRGVELRGKTPSSGDVPVVESVVGNVATLAWSDLINYRSSNYVSGTDETQWVKVAENISDGDMYRVDIYVYSTDGIRVNNKLAYKVSVLDGVVQIGVIADSTSINKTGFVSTTSKIFLDMGLDVQVYGTTNDYRMYIKISAGSNVDAYIDINTWDLKNVEVINITNTIGMPSDIIYSISSNKIGTDTASSIHYVNSCTTEMVDSMHVERSIRVKDLVRNKPEYGPSQPLIIYDNDGGLVSYDKRYATRYADYTVSPTSLVIPTSDPHSALGVHQDAIGNVHLHGILHPTQDIFTGDVLFTIDDALLHQNTLDVNSIGVNYACLFNYYPIYFTPYIDKLAGSCRFMLKIQPSASPATTWEVTAVGSIDDGVNPVTGWKIELNGIVLSGV
jgi:hypothetical protein